MITEQNILSHELIGLKAKIKKMRGLIVDESKNTITVWDKKNERIIPKKNNEIAVKIGDKMMILNGDEFISKPYDRVKNKKKVTNKWH